MALAFYAYIKSTLQSLARDERAQDAFEYLLVIGGISVAVVIAITTIGFGTMAGAVIDGVCTALDTVGAITIAAGACTA